MPRTAARPSRRKAFPRPAGRLSAPMPVLRGPRAPPRHEEDGDLELEALQQAGGAGLLPPMAEQQAQAVGEEDQDVLDDMDPEGHRNRRFDVHRVDLERARQLVQVVQIPGGLRNEKAMEHEKAVPPPPHPPELFPLHTLVGFVGSCGRGKTNAVYLLAKRYLDYGSFTKVYLISPTYESNMLWKQLPKLDKSDVYQDVATAQAAIADILAKIAQDASVFEFHQLYKTAYDKWKANKELKPEEETLLNSMEYVEPQPVLQPSPLIIIDDMSNSPLFRTGASNPFINLVLRHRHINKVGASLFVCVQNFKSGIPKVLRENFRVFCIFDTKDSRVLEGIYDEVGSITTEDAFVQNYTLAINRNPHNFLTVDKFPDAPNPQAAKLKHFRRNFDEFLVDPWTKREVMRALEDEPSSSPPKEKESEFQDPLRPKRVDREPGHAGRRRLNATQARYLERIADPYSRVALRV